MGHTLGGGGGRVGTPPQRVVRWLAVTSLPRCAELAWWLTCWLRGRAEDLAAGGGFAIGQELLGRLRRTGADGAGLALPRPGDPLGLAGPADLTRAALEAGEAVLVGGLGLVPVGQGLEAYAAQPRPAPDLGSADRELRATIVTTAEALADLDVARWQPELADALLDLRRRPVLSPPPGTPGAAAGLAARGAQALAIAELGLATEGAAVSAWELWARAGVLRDLDRASRRAIVAGCSADAWPPVPSEAP